MGSRRRFNRVYRKGAPWEIGRPQPAVVALAERGGFEGSVLDVGCGTGENALLLAGRGLEVVAVDVASVAIRRARAKAAARGLGVEFRVGDGLKLQRLGRRFDRLLDSGLFHVFPELMRARYVRSLAAAVRPGGLVYVFCFSDREPAGWGPPGRLSREAMEAAFSGPQWRVVSVAPAGFVTRLRPEPARAWLTTVERAPMDGSPNV